MYDYKQNNKTHHSKQQSPIIWKINIKKRNVLKRFLFIKKGKGYNDFLNITLKRGYYWEKIDINQFKTTLKKGVIEINYPL